MFPFYKTGAHMLKISSLLIYSFLSGICFFNVNVAQAFAFEDELSYYIIEGESKITGVKLGLLIDSHPNYKNPTLKHSLQSVTQPKNRVIAAPSTPQEIIQLFKDQDLVRHVDEPILSAEGQVRTFNNTYGIEFSGHGAVEEKVIGLIKSLMGQGNIAFLDIGAGYGAFAKRVIEACKDDLDKMTLYINECLSVQCYHAAKLLEEWKQIFFYPRDILFDLNYNEMDRQFHVSTIFNVHHFMSSFEFEDSIKKTYDFTLPNGYHIAISLSPYHLGDDSKLARLHDARAAGHMDHPGFFTGRDLSLLGLVNIRDSYLPSQEVYERVFRSAGFSVKETGYFSLTKKHPREFTYIIGKKK